MALSERYFDHKKGMQCTVHCDDIIERRSKLKVLWKGSKFKNYSIDDSARHGEQAEVSFFHPNDYIFYEEYEIDVDENQYAYKDDRIPQTREE